MKKILFFILFFSFEIYAEEVIENYWILRKKLIESEKSIYLGASIQLSEKENAINEELMRLKRQEFNKKPFPPSRHFFRMKNEIEKSQLWPFLQALPKASALHLHDLALVSTDWLITNMTYRPELYWCQKPPENRVYFRFGSLDQTCNWKLVNESRLEVPDLDATFRKSMTLETLNPEEKYKNSNEPWNSFLKTFLTIAGLVAYEKTLPDYLYQVYQEFYDDKVIYLEIRSLLIQGYKSDGSSMASKEMLKYFRDASIRFQKNNPLWQGVRVIYSPSRSLVTSRSASNYLNIGLDLQKEFPDIFLGMDFVGHEDPGHKLKDYVRAVISVGKQMRFFFHAGETNWNGITDMNLLDAVLLNTSRIGHGYGITKHPQVMRYAKQHNIPIEVNPISNQVLGYVNDLRNHPASILLAQNMSVVVSSDDPSFFGCKGVSYDWYEMFIGVANFGADLKFLKQLALNSIEYSGLSPSDKTNLKNVWQNQWELFIENQTLNLLANKLHGQNAIHQGCSAKK